MFDLENAIKNWKRELRSNPAFEDGDIAELESHLREVIERFRDEGYADEEAFRKAVDEIGEAGQIGQELYKTRTVKPDATPFWEKQTPILSLLPNYFISAIRNIKRRPIFSVVNIFGLSAGMAVCILAFSFIERELRFDTFHLKKDNIFRVAVEMSPEVAGSQRTIAVSQPGLAPALSSEIPEIVRSVRIRSFEFSLEAGELVNREKVLVAEKGFFEMFSFPLVRGEPSRVLKTPNAIVISGKKARTYFGNKDPVGKNIQLTFEGEHHEFTVTGILEEIPEQSSIQFDFVVPYQWLISRDNHYRDFWWAATVYTFLETREGIAASSLREKLRTVTDYHMGDRLEESGKPRDGIRFKLQPVDDLHLNTRVELWPGILPLGPPPSNLTYSFILGGIALLILLIACINYISFAIGNSVTRAREIGVRKVFGAQRSNVMIQYWGESLLLTLFALIGGIAIAYAFLPVFNDMVGREFSAGRWTDLAYLSAYFSIWLGTSLAAGFYPAYILSNYQPGRVLKTHIQVRRKTTLTKSLVVVQFISTVILIIGVIVISRQLQYLRQQTLSPDQNRVLIVRNQPVNGQSYESAYRLFKRNVMQKGVEAVTASYGKLGDNYWMSGYGRDGDNLTDARILFVDTNYLDFHEHSMVTGRFFREGESTDSKELIVVNEAFVRALALSDPVGTHLQSRGNGTAEVIGVVEDFHFESLHTEIQPAVLRPLNDQLAPTRYISIKFDPAQTASTLKAARQTWKELHSGQPFGYSFLDDMFGQIYQREQRWELVISYASLISILIACLGIAGQASIAVSRRRKEIGIRKVLGAGVPGIILLFEREFVIPVIVGFIVALPLAYYLVYRWLQNFAYRIELESWIFLAAGLVTMAIAVLTIGFQTVQAALQNPVINLQND